jgi:hypothetical protein
MPVANTADGSRSDHVSTPSIAIDAAMDHSGSGGLCSQT